MPTFEHRGWNLYYEDRGDGPAVLLMHGLFMDHTVLAPQAEVLAARGYRVITPDLRGHGRSEHRAEERTMWDLVDDQVALLDAQGIERAVWGGHSVAGPISLRAALRHPDRVAGLVLISTQAGTEHPDRFALYEGFAEMVAAKGWTEDALHGSAVTNFGPNAPEELKKQWFERWRAQPTEDAPHIMRALTRRESLLDRLGEIRVPALVIYADEDRIALQPDEVDAMVNGLPNVVEYVRVPGSGHTPTLEAPDVVNDALARFLDGLRPAG